MEEFYVPQEQRIIQSPLDEARVQHGLGGDSFNGVMKTEAHVWGLLQQMETPNLYSIFQEGALEIKGGNNLGKTKEVLWDSRSEHT